jgi:hypothetical protein
MEPFKVAVMRWERIKFRPQGPPRTADLIDGTKGGRVQPGTANDYSFEPLSRVQNKVDRFWIYGSATGRKKEEVGRTSASSALASVPTKNTPAQRRGEW